MNVVLSIPEPHCRIKFVYFLLFANVRIVLKNRKRVVVVVIATELNCSERVNFLGGYEKSYSLSNSSMHLDSIM